MKLYLTRHGETLFNQLKLSQGWCDSPLTELGIKQAQVLGDTLKDIPFKTIYSSTSERSVDTATIIQQANLNNPEIIETKMLKEANFGMLEGITDPLRMSLLRKDPDDFSFIYELKQGYKAYKGESYDEVLDRVKYMLDMVEKSTTDEDCILFVSHGGYLRIIIDYLFGESLSSLTRVMPNGSCIVIEYVDGHYNYIETIKCDVSRETK